MKIIILKEHHGNRYLDISNNEKFNKVVLSIIKGRFSGDNDYYSVELAINPPDPPDFTEEDIEKMPESFKTEAKYRLYSYQQSLEFYNNEIKERELIRQCIENNDAKLAWKILHSRQKYEDEDFEIIDVDDEY